MNETEYILSSLPTKHVFKNIPQLPYDEVVVQEREWDKGLPCIIGRYTNSIKKFNSESNWLIITAFAFNEHFLRF